MSGAEAARPPPAGARPLDAVALGLLAAGHLFVDLSQGAVPAMLPFFAQSRHLSYASAAGLVLAQTFSSSIVQPLFGRLSDRWPAPWLVPGGVAVAGIGLAAASQLPSYPLIWLAIAAGGLGVAAYHPEAARYAGLASGDRTATGMSYFSVGGSIGFACGPLLVLPLMIGLGLEGGWVLAPLGLAVALALTLGLGRVHGLRTAVSAVAARRADLGAGPGPDRWSAFARLTGTVLLRSTVFYGLNTFIPFYWIAVLGQSKPVAGAALGTLLVTGIAGTLVGGRLGDRFDRRSVVAGSLSATAVLVLALTSSPNVVVATALLVPLGLALHASQSLFVVIGQEYLPRHVGTASGVTLGLAVSVGGIAAPGLGLVGDHLGLHTAFLTLAGLSGLAVAIALTLPGRRIFSGVPAA